MALALPKPIPKYLSSPSLTHLFSSSSSSIPPPPPPPSQPNGSQQDQQQNDISSYFKDIKSKLKQQTSSPNPSPFRNPNNNSSFPPKPNSRIASLEEINKNLAQFRIRSEAPTSVPSQENRQISFQELYKRNKAAKSGDGIGTVSPGSQPGPLQAIKESLRQIKNKLPDAGGSVVSNERRTEGFTFSAFRNGLRLRPDNEGSDGVRSSVIGGTQGLPMKIFGKEMNKEDESGKLGPSRRFLIPYSHEDLGERLRALRPKVKAREKNWFSLRELNERLNKLRENEEESSKRTVGGLPTHELRDGLQKLVRDREEKSKSNAVFRMNLLGQFGTQNYMLQPPKEHLVEKYFHQDNMSSAEKMKIELSKVREEFKMSESDCGSARVQVAQLTTKIKHLSNVLHKKDKHSRKGLLAMVQKRKKLLKYLRRTDWDSYCLVLGKLGLRDNPDYKN